MSQCEVLGKLLIPAIPPSTVKDAQLLIFSITVFEKLMHKKVFAASFTAKVFIYVLLLLLRYKTTDLKDPHEQKS